MSGERQFCWGLFKSHINAATVLYYCLVCSLGAWEQVESNANSEREREGIV